MTINEWSPLELAALADCLTKKDEFYTVHPYYRTLSRNYDRIACYLNTHIHQGQPIRNAKSVHSACNARRTSLPGHRSRYG